MFLPAAGASIDLEKTSQDYKDTDTGYFWNRFSFWNYARPPTVILEVGLGPESQEPGWSKAPEKGPSKSKGVGLAMLREESTEVRAWPRQESEEGVKVQAVVGPGSK